MFDTDKHGRGKVDNIIMYASNLPFSTLWFSLTMEVSRGPGEVCRSPPFCSLLSSGHLFCYLLPFLLCSLLSTLTSACHPTALQSSFP